MLLWYFYQLIFVRKSSARDKKLRSKIKQVKSIDRQRWLILASHPLRLYLSISVGWFLINGQLFRMLGWGLWQTSSNDSGGGRRAGTREWGHGDGWGWHDDDDYNNRDFRGLEIAARAFPRPNTQCCRFLFNELQYDQRCSKLFSEE